MTTPRGSKNINSYKEQRLRSARKGLNESVTFSKDIEQLESAMKLSINRRSSGALNTMRLSLQRELSESFSVISPPLTESSLRLSNVNDRFISKYMDKNSNIVQVSEEEPVSYVLAEKTLSTNNVLKQKKKLTQSVRRELKIQKVTPSSTKNLGRITESRIIQKAIKKKVNKAEVTRMIKRVQGLEEEILKLELPAGKEISHCFQTIINRLRQQS